MLQKTRLIIRGNITSIILNKREYTNKSSLDHLSKKLQSSKIKHKDKKKIESQLQLMMRKNLTETPQDDIRNQESPPIIKFKDAPVLKKTLDFIEENKLGLRRTKKRTKEEKKDPFHYIIKDDPNDSFTFYNGKKLHLIASATQLEHFPQDGVVPEVCFIGRSNVGKSSLVNAITNSAKVKTSDKPGETQTLNWYSVPNEACFVDLPGYGFSFSNESKKKSWESLTKHYLENRKSLKRCLLLVDARVGFKKTDYDMMDYLDSIKRKYQIVLTKADLVLPSDLAKRHYVTQFALKYRKHALNDVFMTSSKTRAGIGRLKRDLASIFQSKSSNHDSSQ